MIDGTKHLLIINDTTVERVTSTMFLGMHITEALIWPSNANLQIKVVGFFCFSFLLFYKTRNSFTVLFIVFIKGLTVHFNPVHAAVLTKQTLTCFHVSN